MRDLREVTKGLRLRRRLRLREKSLGCGYGCILTALLFFASPLPAADWPWFLGPNYDGISKETGLLKTWPAEGPPIIWRRKLGSSYAPPSAAGDDLLLFHRIGNEEIVECISPNDQKLKWKFAYPTSYRDMYGYSNGTRCQPIITKEHVFTFGAEGKLHCLNRKTGEKVWGRDLNSEYKVEQNFFGVGGAPLLEGDLLLINIGGEGAGVVALDHRTGKTVWKATDDGASYASPVCATINGKRLAIFFTRSGLVVTDVKTGVVQSTAKFRSRTHESVNGANPVVVGDQVLLSAAYRTGAVLLKVKPDSVQEVWKSMVLMTHWATPIYLDGYVYGCSGRHRSNASIRCVEFKTGELIWEREDSDRFNMLRADGRFIILTEAGVLVLAEMSPDGYKEISRTSKPILRYPCYAPPILAKGKLYVRDETQVLCLDLREKKASEGE